MIAGLGQEADHRDVERAFLQAGWTRRGAGDWAIALRSPDGAAAARISPFDPTGPYSAELYRQAAHTGQVPVLFAHRRLVGGGDLQMLVVIDLFYADGPNLYETAKTDPDRFVALIPEAERRYMTEIPLGASGPWDPADREALRAIVAAADARRGADQ